MLVQPGTEETEEVFEEDSEAVDNPEDDQTTTEEEIADKEETEEVSEDTIAPLEITPQITPRMKSKTNSTLKIRKTKKGEVFSPKQQRMAQNVDNYGFILVFNVECMQCNH
jgi:hypothetical protein